MGQVNQNRQPYALLEGDLINRPAFFEEVVPSVHMSPTMNADRHSAAVQSSATIRATIAGGFENFDRDRRVVRINGSCGIQGVSQVDGGKFDIPVCLSRTMRGTFDRQRMLPVQQLPHTLRTQRVGYGRSPCDS